MRTVQHAGLFYNLTRKLPGGRFRGALFSVFNNSGEGPFNHPLDTEVQDYHRVINEIVIPDCMKLAPDAKGYPERIKELISYSNLALGDTWNFGVELSYRLLAPAQHQTKENLTKARLLRAAMDLSFSMNAVIDDVTDKSQTRLNKKAWHTFCSGGESAAIYDGSIFGYIPFYILKKHFKYDPGYALMMEKVAEANTCTLIGQTLDVVCHGRDVTYENYADIVNYKAGGLACIQPALGMLHAGILDENLINQMTNIFCRLGTLFQIWDDFREYFCTENVTGKPPCDFQNAGTTWVSATAVKYFNSVQMNTFKGCYGSTNPENVEIVKKLYDDIDMPSKYIEFMRNAYVAVSRLIESVPDAKLRNVCYTYMDWLIEDVKDVY